MTTLIGSASPAMADSCDHSVHGVAGSGTTTYLPHVVGDPSYNNTGSSMDMTVNVGSNHSWGETKEVTYGAESGINWSIVSAKISATWGSSAITGASVSVDTSLRITVPSHWTGWISVEPYRHYYWWRGMTERWDAQKAACVTYEVSGASWGDAERLLVANTHAGKYYPKSAKH